MTCGNQIRTNSWEIQKKKDTVCHTRRHKFLSLAPKILCMSSVAESSSSFQPLISVMAGHAAKTVLFENASVGDNL